MFLMLLSSLGFRRNLKVEKVEKLGYDSKVRVHLHGATTLSIVTLSLMTLSLMTFSLMTLSITTNKVTFTLMILSVAIKNVTLSITALYFR
jgi:hypothetical protein